MIYKGEGIILRGRNLGEADRILTIYTREHGKLNAVAKGARRNRSKLKGVTQPLIYADLVLYRGRNLDTITQATVKEMFIFIREDLNRWAYANYIVEILNAMVPERQPQEEVFILFLTAMHLIAALEEPELGALFFAVRLLGLQGFQPQLTRCASCASSLKEGSKNVLSGAYGGLLCTNCSSQDGRAFPISLGAAAAWGQLLRWDVQHISRLRLTPYLRKQLFRSISYYLQYQLERQLKSVAFLRHLDQLDEDKNNPFQEK